MVKQEKGSKVTSLNFSVDKQSAFALLAQFLALREVTLCISPHPSFLLRRKKLGQQPKYFTLAAGESGKAGSRCMS